MDPNTWYLGMSFSRRSVRVETVWSRRTKEQRGFYPTPIGYGNGDSRAEANGKLENNGPGVPLFITEFMQKGMTRAWENTSGAGLGC